MFSIRAFPMPKMAAPSNFRQKFCFSFHGTKSQAPPQNLPAKKQQIVNSNSFRTYLLVNIARHCVGYKPIDIQIIVKNHEFIKVVGLRCKTAIFSLTARISQVNGFIFAKVQHFY